MQPNRASLPGSRPYWVRLPLAAEAGPCPGAAGSAGGLACSSAASAQGAMRQHGHLLPVTISDIKN